MKKIVKIISFVTAIAVTVTALGGCGKNESATDNSQKKVKWLLGYTKPADHEKVMESLKADIKEKTGIELEIMTFDNGSYGEKMNLILSSGDYFDICHTNSNLKTSYKTAVKKNLFYKLDDLLEGEYKDLKSEIPDFVWDTIKIDGGIYGVPSYQMMFQNITATVGESLAKKYNFNTDSVDELKDLESMLKVIKENEPDYIPFVPSWTPLGITYQNVESQVYVRKDDPDMKLYLPYEAPEYIEYLEMVHDWYKKGYIAADAATNNSTSNDKITAFMCTNYKPGVEANEIVRYGEKKIHMELSAPIVGPIQGQSAINAISAHSVNPESALEILRLMYTDKDIYNKFCFGIEGEHYKKVGENRIEKLNDKYDLTVAWMFGNQFNAFLQPSQSDDVWEQTEKMNNEALKSNLTGFSVDVTNIRNEISAVSAVQGEYEKFLNYGVENPHNHLEAYKMKLQKAGIEKIREEIQLQLDEWKKTK